MSYKVYENPKWLRDAVRTRFPRRQSIGALPEDYRSFMRHITVRPVRFHDDQPEELDGSQVIIDVDRKVYENKGSDTDTVKVNSQKDEKHTSTKNYQLTVGQSRGNQFNVGGNVGLDASFFNVGGVGVGVEAGYTRTNEKRGEQQYGEQRSAELGKTYGAVAEVKIPQKTKLTVEVTTYSLTYLAQRVQIEISAPSTARLLVYLESVPCCYSCGKPNFVYVHPSDFLRSLNETGEIQTDDNGRVSIMSESRLTYLGEKTKISKIEEKLS